MSKRKSSSQNTIDTIIKINFNLTKKIINQLELFNPLENEYLLEQLEQLLEFKGKKIKNESSSNIYSEITIFQIKKIMNVLCKLELHQLIQNPDNDLKFKINELKKEVINDLTELEFDYEINKNIEEDILEDTDLNYDNNNTINDEPINGEQINDTPINDEQINDEPINNEPINDEQINESNHNNESIDPTIKKSTNNEKTINKSADNEKTINKSTINKMIEDFFPLLFEYLSINDLFNCRLVNKQFKKLSDNTNGINKLIIGKPDFYNDNFWSYNNTKIEDKDLISSKCFKRVNLLSIFNLDKNLKYLKIYDKQFQLTEISNLINLESLELGHDYYCGSYNQQIMDLNNLKFLLHNYQSVKFNTPKLEKIQLPDLSYIRSINNPESIKHLIAKYYNVNELKILKNLEIIELRNIEYKTLTSKFLIFFKNLKQLKINLNFKKVKYSEERIRKSLIKTLIDKIKLKKKIDIYLEGIKIVNIDNFIKLINIDKYSYWRFVLANYNLLDSNISFIETLSYGNLEKCFNKPIIDLPDNFFDKFHRIHRIEIFDIKDVNGLKWFLNNLQIFSYLHIGSEVSLGQHFYDYNLPNTIKFLFIHTKEDVNYKFILKLPKLIQLFTVIDKDLFDLVFTSFLNLKYLNYFVFYFNGKKITIFKKGDNYFYLNQIRAKLDYNQLREECNKIRAK